MEGTERMLADTQELFEMARGEGDTSTLEQLAGDIEQLEKAIARMEFERMFSDPLDPANCFIDIQAGTGGTEAQDWAQMLERMYLRFCERREFKVRAATSRASRVHRSR